MYKISDEVKYLCLVLVVILGITGVVAIAGNSVRHQNQLEHERQIEIIKLKKELECER